MLYMSLGWGGFKYSGKMEILTFAKKDSFK